VCMHSGCTVQLTVKLEHVGNVEDAGLMYGKPTCLTMPTMIIVTNTTLVVDTDRADCALVVARLQVLDTEGVGELIRIAVQRGRATRRGLKIGVCGEQAGDPKSVEFLNSVGLDYVSCSPFRVPIARLAAAQAAVKAAAKK
jgi:phosphoenolpyruvate synthase/pyruvate phosphate dikinase